MIHALFVVGNVASGKTTLWEHYQKLLNSSGIPYSLLTDRWAFEDAVLDDTGVRIPHDGNVPVEGALSKYWGGEERGKIKFEITDGDLGNRAHENMVRTVAANPQRFYLVEYAIGPQIPFPDGAPFDQTGDGMLGLLEQYSCAHTVCVVEAQANLAVRIARNHERNIVTNDGVPEHLMEKFWFDGGRIPEEHRKVFAGYHEIDNNRLDRASFIKAGELYFHEHIRPHIYPERSQNGK